MSGWIRPGRPSPAALDALLVRVASAAVTYDHVGSTVEPDQWPERAPYERSIVVGRGSVDFEAACAALRRWRCHVEIGARAYPPDARLEVGTSMLVVLGAGPVSVVVPDRIVAVLDEPRRFGFAYGTLPGHQERGEELFLVELGDDDIVRATIRVDAGPATLLARLGTPVVGLLQRLALDGYLRGVRRAVAEGPAP